MLRNDLGKHALKQGKIVWAQKNVGWNTATHELRLRQGAGLGKR